eukprot:TRINITY_DN1448_c2_g1_i1.p1 TRINITY_DN1448_c2_g1~~TRINITY_DN1448_c2_g1_i1.p1  ORF type:complete len:423 (-),score=72.98 TRINITY_DN1448_c2_g1_i1:111-1337(-)
MASRCLYPHTPPRATLLFFAAFLCLSTAAGSSIAVDDPIRIRLEGAGNVTINATFEYIFPNGTWPYSHVCSIAQTYDGAINAVWQAGPNEAAPQQNIYTSRKAVGGTWNTPTVLTNDNYCTMNPSLYYDYNTNELFAIFHHNTFENGECDTKNWTASYVASRTAGLLWNNATSKQIPLPDGFLGSVKNQCITMSNGDVLCPSSYESPYNNNTNQQLWTCHAETTNQNFSDWFHMSNEIHFGNGTACNESGCIQPSFLEVSPGVIVSVMRSGCGELSWSYSKDYGQTFLSPSLPTNVPNPDAGIDATVMMGEDLLGMLLIFNNSTSERCPLSLAQCLNTGDVGGGSTSGGVGQDWTHLTDLMSNCEAGDTYQYPFIIQDRFESNVAHVCFTWTQTNSRSIGYGRLEFAT